VSRKGNKGERGKKRERSKPFLKLEEKKESTASLCARTIIRQPVQALIIQTLEDISEKGKKICKWGKTREKGGWGH